MRLDVEGRLAGLGLELPQAPSPAANHVPFTVAKGLLFIAGQAPVRGGQYACTGRVGAEVTVEAAQAAARLCGLNILAQVKAALGDAGKHARSALGVAALRGNVPVVVDAIFELAD